MPIIFAQAPATQNGDGSIFFFAIFAFSLAVIWFAMIRPQQRQEKKVRDMMSGLKKNDRVFTIGGIVGSIHSVDHEKKEIVLKVDDSNNTKIKFLLSAVAGVLDAEN